MTKKYIVLPSFFALWYLIYTKAKTKMKVAAKVLAHMSYLK